ncbi:MAG TPA: MlaD family protein [Chitinophagaceae bacterium]|nr:MlaD family protein [Chitinophagaceae bacterium]
MKISNETKVGILTVVALTVLILGFNFLKGKDVFNPSKKIYAVFSKLGALEKSNYVKINGLTIGSVSDLEPTDKNVKGIKVTIRLTMDVNIPVNSVAYISAGLLGTANITIDPGDSTVFLKDGEMLKTREDPGIFGDLPSQAGSTLTNVRTSLDSLKIVFTNINRLFDANTKGNLQQIIDNLAATSKSLAKMLDENGALATTMRNTSSITDNLKKNNDSITLIISNTRRLTTKLSQLEIQQAVDSFQLVLSKLSMAISKMTSPDGSLGALMNDKKLFNNINELTLSLQILSDDIRVHPKRYFGNLIFNRKDKTGPLTSPSKKDSLP